MGELLARVDSTELTEWIAYERFAGPLGPARADIQAAIVAMTVANTRRGKKGRPLKVSDFIPVWDRKPQDWRQQLAIAQALNARLGGEDMRERHRESPGPSRG